jgi:succinate dehydrogenase hydrophobic anchor subunit
MLRNLTTDRLLLVCSTMIVVVVVTAFVVLDVTGYGAQARADVQLLGSAVIALATVTTLGSKLIHVQSGVNEVTNGLLQSKIDSASVTAAETVAAEHDLALPVVSPVVQVVPRAPVGTANPWEAEHGKLAIATPPVASQT